MLEGFVIDDHHHQLQKYGGNVKEFNFDEFFKSTFEPKIADDAEKGGKKIDLSLDMTGFRPDQIQIHLKDHELIVQVGHVERRLRRNTFSSLSSRPNLAHQTNTQRAHTSTRL